jgi:hypothetical protein
MSRKPEQAGVIYVLIFLVGSMSGVIVGLALCARYFSSEMAANIGPRLKHVELQLDTIQAELNLAITDRLSELTTRGDSLRVRH